MPAVVTMTVTNLATARTLAAHIAADGFAVTGACSTRSISSTTVPAAAFAYVTSSMTPCPVTVSSRAASMFATCPS